MDDSLGHRSLSAGYDPKDWATAVGDPQRFPLDIVEHRKTPLIQRIAAAFQVTMIVGIMGYIAWGWTYRMDDRLTTRHHVIADHKNWAIQWKNGAWRSK